MGLSADIKKAFFGVMGEDVLDGTQKRTKIKILVRNLEKKVETDVDKMGVILEDNGLVNKIKIGNADVKFLDANQVYNKTIEELKNNPYVLCKFNS